MEKPEFRSIGHLATTTWNTRGEQDWTSRRSQTRSSDTETTSLHPGSSVPRGAVGSISLSASTVAAAAAFRAVPDQDLRTLLPSSVSSCLAGEWRAVECEIDGWEKATFVGTEVFCGYKLKDLPPEPDLERARSIFRAKLTPAGRDAALQELTRLWVTTRKPNISDKQKELMLSAYAEDLEVYPEDIITAACRNPPRWKFWPELGPLLDRADALLAEWRQFDEALSPNEVERVRKRKAAQPEAAEALARRRQEILAHKAERQRRWDEAAKWRAENPGPHGQPVRTVQSVAMDAITGADPVTGKPPLSTSEAMKRVWAELSSFRLLDEDDARVQAQLREMGIDRTAA